MNATDRSIIATTVAICVLLAFAGAVWLPWWALPFFGAAVVWVAPMLAALMARMGSRS